MAIVNALAGIMVSDLTTAEAWYEQLLSRPARTCKRSARRSTISSALAAAQKE